jgi:hypothetical protein
MMCTCRQMQRFHKQHGRWRNKGYKKIQKCVPCHMVSGRRFLLDPMTIERLLKPLKLSTIYLPFRSFVCLLVSWRGWRAWLWE